jgi:uncharacterized protein with PQ loop repeat
MSSLAIIKSLYTINGIVALLMYLPQILSILKNKGNTGSISLVTFGGWSIGCAITVLYAWLCVGDRLFTLVALGNMTGCGIVFSLVAAGRLRQPKASKYPAGEMPE